MLKVPREKAPCLPSLCLLRDNIEECRFLGSRINGVFEVLIGDLVFIREIAPFPESKVLL